ncbi:NUDIX hydrolase [Flavobacterium sp. Fl-77]|uniref:NUDIX hydrolase n=1 Tax=Flavobacterium flavipigmentatum TaxID=2893884 RepID=A0AAJ2S9J4_9FLAO|nr:MULTISPECIES: NUDIX domain-containing protein [unclassified Flavobacterium]MDX6183470.1 NUDIX hydrolase [Flavobacterium sp. Fl-33]MDX6187128.1 NUDIX hydrolase [Flavobacterium sp. Fl-77]UFH40142.1 NUDIX hydrolase [Flavobacterium sp. F-70]
MLQGVIENNANYQPGLSIDCVIFGFHHNQLKVLLLKTPFESKWSLPGGFVPIDEDIDTAAVTVLNVRTGMEGIFLRQFATFGKVKRNDKHFNDTVLDYLKIPQQEVKWFTQRFITIGYYALVDFLKAVPQKGNHQEIIEWIDHKEMPELILDHKEILDKALETLRAELNLMPIGYNLLPEKFTIPELQKLYETILDRKLDRRNFLRKITNIGILNKLDEKKSNVAHKAPNLYTFDKEKYQEVLKNGLNQGW